MPLFTPRGRSWPDPAHDPRAWEIPGLTGDDGLPRTSMLVGGCADLGSTLHVREQVRDGGLFTEILSQIARLAANEGRGLIFPYVYEQTKNTLTRAVGTLAWRLLGREAMLHNVSDEDWEDRIGGSARNEWRRDRRLIARMEVVSEVRTWAEVEGTAAEDGARGAAGSPGTGADALPAVGSVRRSGMPCFHRPHPDATRSHDGTSLEWRARGIRGGNFRDPWT